MQNTDLSNLYEEVFVLLEEKSKFEDSAEPYKSKYEAREKLETMKRIISSELDKQSSHGILSNQEEFSVVKAQLAAVVVHLGIIGLETEELSTGQEHLEKAIEIISGHEMSPWCISLAVLCFNNLAILWAHRDEQEKAHLNLSHARELYTKYRNQNEAAPPSALHELFISNPLTPGGWKVLEKFHTLTLYYLAQVMGQLGKTEASAHLCLSTLHRQLSSGEFDPFTWAINAATLAKFYYQDNQKYRLARRLLAAAWTVLDSPAGLDSGGGEGGGAGGGEAAAQHTAEEREEKMSETKAEVARRWGAYCVNLLQDSFEALATEAGQEGQEGEGEEEEQHPGQLEVTADVSSEEHCLEQMEFCQLELCSVEGKTEWQKAKTYDDAKQVFMSGLRWLSEARAFYTLEDHASTHAKVIQDTSTLYKLLSQFEPAPDRRSKMHKRRVDLLKPILEELNSQYYLEICRQLDYELGETFSEMVNCKYESLDKALPNPQQAAKVNLLVQSGVTHFDNYLHSFRSNRGEQPDRYPEESERPVLVAYFHLGRLWSKMVSAATPDKLRDVTKCFESYKYMVDYCDRHPSRAHLVSLELPACREMVELLPYKMQRIKDQL